MAINTLRDLAYHISTCLTPPSQVEWEDFRRMAAELYAGAAEPARKGKAKAKGAPIYREARLEPTCHLAASAHALRAAIAVILPALAKASSIPILECMLVRRSGDSVTVTGTDLEMSATVAVEGADLAKGWTFAVNARALFGLLHDMTPEDIVQIEFIPGPPGTKVMDCCRVKVRDTFSTIPAQTAADFPMPLVEENDSPVVGLTLGAAQLHNVLRFVAPCMSTEMTRYYLNGACLRREGESVFAVATDGHRIARTMLQSTGLPDMDIIIPNATVYALLRTYLPPVALVDGTISVELMRPVAGEKPTHSHNLMRITAGGVTFSSKLIDGEFPDYHRVIPSTRERCVASFTAKDMEAALMRLKKAHPKDRNIAAVLGQGENSELILRAHSSSDGASVRVPVELGSRFDDTPIGFQANYLLEAMRVMPEGRLALYQRETGEPAVIELPDGSVFCVMPYKV